MLQPRVTVNRFKIKQKKVYKTEEKNQTNKKKKKKIIVKKNIN